MYKLLKHSKMKVQFNVCPFLLILEVLLGNTNCEFESAFWDRVLGEVLFFFFLQSPLLLIPHV